MHKKIRFESVMLHVSIIQIEKYIDVYYSSCLGATLLSTCYVKSLRILTEHTLNTIGQYNGRFSV